jgi:hypothetical protein
VEEEERELGEMDVDMALLPPRLEPPVCWCKGDVTLL